MSTGRLAVVTCLHLPIRQKGRYTLGEKDAVHKILESYNDVFADIINVLLFDGEQVISEHDLVDRTPYGFYKAAGGVHEEIRDIAKLWQSENARISCLGIENQEKPDPDMPLRVIGYDAAEYRAQLLSDNANSDRYAVITLVLYYGYKNRWSGPLRLKECLDIPDEMDPLINDYRINLFEIAYLDRATVNKFRSDFRIVADYFVQKQENGDYIPSDQEIRHVDAVLQLLSVFEHDDRFTDVYNEYIQAKEPMRGGTTMCDVLDRVENRGVEKGRTEERENNICTMYEECHDVNLISRLLRVDVAMVQDVLARKALLQ